MNPREASRSGRKPRLKWLSASSLAATLLGCTTHASPQSAPGPASVENNRGARLEDSEPIPAPSGSKRLPSSIACEPTQPSDAGIVMRTDGGPYGSLDKEDIRRVIRKHIPEVKACYDARMIAPPYPQGKLVTKISIDADGKVRHSCVVDSELQDPVIDRCIVDAILGWEFPKPDGGGWVIVTYPFVLTPG